MSGELRELRRGNAKKLAGEFPVLVRDVLYLEGERYIETENLELVVDTPDELQVRFFGRVQWDGELLKFEGFLDADIIVGRASVSFTCLHPEVRRSVSNCLKESWVRRVTTANDDVHHGFVMVRLVLR